MTVIWNRTSIMVITTDMSKMSDLLVEYRLFWFKIFAIWNQLDFVKTCKLLLPVVSCHWDNGHFGRNNGYFEKLQRSIWTSIAVILIHDNGHFDHDFCWLTVTLVCPKWLLLKIRKITVILDNGRFGSHSVSPH